MKSDPIQKNANYFAWRMICAFLLAANSASAALLPQPPPAPARLGSQLSSSASPTLISRRACLVSGALALGSTRPALADEASLVAALRDSRSDFDGCGQLVESQRWGDVRQLVASTLILLTLKGWRGASVKSVARERGAEGQELLDARQNLLEALGALDQLAYKGQTGRAGSDNSEAIFTVKRSVSALDAVLKLLIG